MPYDIPGGKYWAIYELANLFGCSTYKLYPIIKQKGIGIGVGQTILVPDSEVEELKKLCPPTAHTSLSQSRAAAVLSVGIDLIKAMVAAGLPVEEGKRIKRMQLPYLEEAIEHFRIIDGVASRMRARDIVVRAMSAMEKKLKIKNKENKQ